MAYNLNINTSNNWNTPGIVMKSALVRDKLSVCCMNSQSICARKMSKLEELKKIANISNVDVMSISESWLNEKISDDVLNIDNYTVIRNDRLGRLGGGIIVYIKKHFHFRILEKSCYIAGETEYIFLELQINKQKILLGFFYNPPEFDCSPLLTQKFSRYEFQYEHILLMGDFNTNILNSQSDRTRRFTSFMENFSFSSLGDTPTQPVPKGGGGGVRVLNPPHNRRSIH